LVVAWFDTLTMTTAPVALPVRWRLFAVTLSLPKGDEESALWLVLVRHAHHDKDRFFFPGKTRDSSLSP